MGLFSKKKDKPLNNVAQSYKDAVGQPTAEEIKDAEAAKGIMAKLRGKIDDGVENAGKNLVLGQIRKTIDRVHKEGRLVFLGDNSLEYTSKQGQKHNLGFGGMADILIEASGWDNLVRLGITPNEVIALIENKYKETKTVDGEVKEI